MNRASVSDEIEAFLARHNQTNDEIAFTHPLEFRCAVLLQPLNARGTFSVDELGLNVHTPGTRQYFFAWEDIFRIEFKAHSIKLFLRYEPVVTIHGAVRAAVIGFFNQMEAM
jgi:hypothetical protein